MLPAQPNESLIDGIRCLQAAATSAAPAGTREIARLLALEPTRANRLLKTLAHMGFLRQNEAQKYEAGPGMHVLAAQSLHASGLVRRALPQLESLAVHGMVVALGVLWNDRVSYLYHWRPGISSAEALGSAAVYPALDSSIGLALLAALPEREVRARLRGRPLGRFATHASVIAELRRTRRRGYGRVGRAPGVVSLALPIGAPAAAAIALAGAMPRNNVPARIDAMRTAAALIERADAAQP
ncbi:helix-turn-helix domain-containing protein [bacterium]|nr:helix-turn-helix domain-containing protein [bacterium]